MFKAQVENLQKANSLLEKQISKEMKSHVLSDEDIMSEKRIELYENLLKQKIDENTNLQNQNVTKSSEIDILNERLEDLKRKLEEFSMDKEEAINQLNYYKKTVESFSQEKLKTQRTMSMSLVKGSPTANEISPTYAFEALEIPSDPPSPGKGQKIMDRIMMERNTVEKDLEILEQSNKEKGYELQEAQIKIKNLNQEKEHLAKIIREYDFAYRKILSDNKLLSKSKGGANIQMIAHLRKLVSFPFHSAPQWRRSWPNLNGIGGESDIGSHKKRRRDQNAEKHAETTTLKLKKPNSTKDKTRIIRWGHGSIE